MGHRRKAREYAMQGLYMHETVGTPIDDLLKLEWLEKEVPEDIRSFALNLMEGAVKNLDHIDGLIRHHSRNWKFERLSAIDKSILRISIYELLFHDDIPSVVTINEGIELGKMFGGESSGQFINGVLDAVKRYEIKREETTGGEPDKEE